MTQFFGLHLFTMALVCVATLSVIHCLDCERLPNYPASLLGWVGLSLFSIGLYGYIGSPATGTLSFLTAPMKQEPFQNFNKFIVGGILLILTDLLKAVWFELRRRTSEKG
jgi:hypothetical protein